MLKNRHHLLALVLLVTSVLNAGCPGKEGTLIKNLVTRFGKPPEITVFIKETGKVKKMDVEEYLLGVVAGEMKPGWPLNAYAAQAIIARTFTMEFLARGGTRKLHNTDISTDEKEAQAYNAANITPTVRNAVKMTKGLVLTYKNRYVKGWYSASCGGRTALAKEGLAYKGPEPPYMRSVKCPEEKRIPEDELYWKATLSSSEINEALKKLNKPDLGNIKAMEVAKRSKSQRATIIKFTGAKGSAEVSGGDFRINVGPEKLRSIWISDEIKHESGKITVKGRGFGHGVGLCQWGSYTLAKQNKSPKAIVKYYYPKAEVSKIW